MDAGLQAIVRFLDNVYGKSALQQPQMGISNIEFLKPCLTLGSEIHLRFLMDLIGELNNEALEIERSLLSQNSVRFAGTQTDDTILETVEDCLVCNHENINRIIESLLLRSDLYPQSKYLREDISGCMIEAAQDLLYAESVLSLAPSATYNSATKVDDCDPYTGDADAGYRLREFCIVNDSPSVATGEDELFAASVDESDELNPKITNLRLSYDLLEIEKSSKKQPVALSAEHCIDKFSLPIVFVPNKTGFEPSKEFDSSAGIVVGGRYEVSGFLGAAAFSKAVKAFDLTTKRHVCLKIIKNDKDYFDQSLDEIKILRLVNKSEGFPQSHCLELLDYFYFKEHLILVTELLRDNLYDFSKFSTTRAGENNHTIYDPLNRQTTTSQQYMNYFTIGRIQRIAKQLAEGLQFIHSLGLIHCDLKLENILFKSYTECEVKIIDFGSACFTTDKISSYVQSRSYRAPEVLLGCSNLISQKMDLWSLGCILAELWTGYVLFQNNSVHALLARIQGIIGNFPKHMLETGSNTQDIFIIEGQKQSIVIQVTMEDGLAANQVLVPQATSLQQRMRTDDDVFVDFLAQLLRIDPDKRMSAAQALKHPWLSTQKYSDGIP